MNKLKLAVSVCVMALASLTAQAQGYKPGDVATDFKLKNVDGKMVSLADYKKAKGFIVIFTCNHCPFAKAYEERIVALDKKYAPKGYPVIAINPNDPALYAEDSYDNMKVRAKEKGFTFPYLFDEGQTVFPQYGATKTPHVFILQKEGAKNMVRYIGAIDNNYANPADVTEKFAEKALDELLTDKPVSQPTTVAIGCGIKVKK
jgi:peroxiredoxin